MVALTSVNETVATVEDTERVTDEGRKDFYGVIIFRYAKIGLENEMGLLTLYSHKSFASMRQYLPFHSVLRKLYTI